MLDAGYWMLGSAGVVVKAARQGGGGRTLSIPAAPKLIRSRHYRHPVSLQHRSSYEVGTTQHPVSSIQYPWQHRSSYEVGTAQYPASSITTDQREPHIPYPASFFGIPFAIPPSVHSITRNKGNIFP
ncbi:MAG: hypothetical protein QF473_00430 [Planctomycetota bacterium]|nr:hypothetical protein [Planctomycetota bacterium]MDP6503997.1 hypothetical protein [Planctomycetota bacterium]